MLLLVRERRMGNVFTGTDLYLVLDLGVLGMKVCEVFMNYHLKSSNDTLCDFFRRKLSISEKINYDIQVNPHHQYHQTLYQGRK